MRNKKKDVNIIAIGKVWRKKNKKIGGERRMTQEDIVILSQLLDQKFEPVYKGLIYWRVMSGNSKVECLK